MNFNHLHYFYVAVKEESVTAAAKILHISQPALSAQLKRLESNLGEPLFIREGRKLELTERGKLLFGYTRQMFQLAEEMQDRLRAGGQARGERINLGVSHEIERPFSVRLIRLFLSSKRRKFPPLVRHSSGTHDELLAALKHREIDVLLSNQVSFHEDIEILGSLKMPVRMLIVDSRYATAAPRWPRERKAVRRFIESMDAGLILPSPALRLRKETDDFFERYQVAKPTVFESDILGAVVRATIEGIGIAFLPMPYVTNELRPRGLVSFGPPEGIWSHPLWLMGRRDHRMGTLYQELSDSFQRMGREIA